MSFDKFFGDLHHIKSNGGVDGTCDASSRIADILPSDVDISSVDTSPETMKYEGSLEDVLKKTESLNKRSPPSWKILMPPRITRGVLDFAIQNNISGQKKYEMVQKSLNISKLAYEEEYRKMRDSITDFRRENKNILSKSVKQGSDLMTWNAYQSTTQISPYDNREKLDEGLRYVYESKGRKPLFLLGLSHGGLPPTLDLYVNLKEEVVDDIYTIRASFSKKADKQMKVTDYENDFIREKAKDNSITLIDEDMWTGKTLMEAENHLEYLGIDYNTLVYDEEANVLTKEKAETLHDTNSFIK